MAKLLFVNSPRLDVHLHVPSCILSWWDERFEVVWTDLAALGYDIAYCEAA